ncbi:MAG: DUF4097 family beta strand repeat protein [Acidobacteriota bacterium]|nr:DUF4097 family beta strand repeat protein [Acidobacteriota bacterium]
MKNTVLLAASLALAVASARAQDATFTRSLHVSSAPTITVHTGSGSIRVHRGGDNEVHIEGHVHASGGWLFGTAADSADRARQIAHDPPIVQSGDTVLIGDQHNNSLFRNISVDYDLTVPANSTLNAGSGSGDITTDGIGASLRASSGSGSIRARDVHGPAFLQTGSGDIELHQTGMGEVRAQTGSGSIRLTGISGALHASTGSGDIEVAGQPTEEWRLDTGSGTQRVTLAVGSPCSLDAETGSGSVQITLPHTDQSGSNRHHTLAAINGGGALIKARTGSGDIQVR